VKNSKSERDKFIYDKLKENGILIVDCWHEWKDNGLVFGNNPKPRFVCKECKESKFVVKRASNPDFSSWGDFKLLLDSEVVNIFQINFRKKEIAVSLGFSHQSILGHWEVFFKETKDIPDRSADAVALWLGYDETRLRA